jgi:hypothetical protein
MARSTQRRKITARGGGHAKVVVSLVKKRVKKRKNLDLTKPVERPRMPFGVIFRVFLIGSVAVGASGYAIYRHYFVPRPSMLVPVPPTTSEPDPASSDLVPVPELVPVPAD